MMFLICPLGLVQCLVMDFGQCTFLYITYRKNHLAIMDDILTHSKREDHVGHLIDLFKAIIRNGLKIPPRKSKLFKKALVFMGITIMIEDGMPKMKPLKSRIDAILKVKLPKTIKD